MALQCSINPKETCGHGQFLSPCMWPLQVILNDLPPDLRFANVIIVALMIVRKEPNPTLMNLFLKTFDNEVKELHDVGFNYDINDNGVEKLLKVSVLCCSVDSVARAVCQNRVQHNGYYSCSYCYIQGSFNKTMRFPFSGNNEVLRTHESHMKDVEDVSENPSKLKSRGVKGPSILSELPNFDMVWSFPFDDLHTGELGAEQFLWELIWKTVNKQDKERINRLLMNIKPPHDVGTLPKELFDLTNYKAKDWRSLSLYYGIPICVNILSDDTLHLYSLLVKSMYILSKMEISSIELEECELLLTLFVMNFQTKYGESCMRFNIHMLLHAVASVRKCGPLWANSTYAYESNIHFLKRLINGSTGVDLQIIKKSINIRSFQIVVDRNSISANSEHARMYCEMLFSNKYTTTNNEKFNGVIYFDAYDADNTVSSNSEKFFQKCIYQGTAYTAVKYKRSSRWNDTFVQLKSGAVAQINDIILSDETCYFNVRLMSTEPLKIKDIVLPHIWKVISVRHYMNRVAIDEVLSKLIYISSSDHEYLCKLPNNLSNQ